MPSKLQQWLDSVPLTDPIERQQAAVFQMILIVWIAFALVGVPILFLLAPPVSPGLNVSMVRLSVTFIQIASLLLVFAPVGAFMALRNGWFKQAVAVATFGLLLSHIIATFLLGSTDAVSVVVYQIPIALAGLLGGRRLLLTIAGLSMATVALAAFLESISTPLVGFLTVAILTANGLGKGNPAVNPSRWISLAFFLVCTILLTFLLDRFGSALQHAFAKALAREEESGGVRASLEETVAERTAALRMTLEDARAYTEEQAHLLAEIENQRTTIRNLSMPVIPINATTLVIPLIGELDGARLQQFQEQSLRALEGTSARILVVDITGVPVVDTYVAQGLLMTVRAVRLLGAEVTLVGIRPEVAQAIVELGIELPNVKTFSDLQSALDRI